MDSDVAQLGDLLIRYASGIDRKDWPLFRSCWADKIDVDYAEVGNFTDPDAFTELMAQVHGSKGATYHRMSARSPATSMTKLRAIGRTCAHTCTPC